MYKFNLNKPLNYPLFLGVLAALFFIPFLGGVHLFDWDEINFAEISREMLLTGEYFQIKLNFLPFWEKPPLFFWLQSFSMSIFGVNEFAARLPNALVGITTLIVLFSIGKQIRDTRFGLLWAGVYFGTVLPFLYFKSGIIDPIFNLFIFLGLHFFIKTVWKNDKNADSTEGLRHSKWYYLLLSGLMIGLAILTKGPAAFIIISLCLGVYWLYERFRFYVSPLQFLFFCGIAGLTLILWFAPDAIQNGTGFIVDFVKYQYRLFSTPDAGHGGFPGYHFVVLLLGCFPASIFAIRAFFKMQKDKKDSQNDYTRWMKILFWVVLILFTIVKSKIVHYSSLAYFPLTYLAALVIDGILRKEVNFNKWMKVGLVLIASLYIIAISTIPFLGKNIALLKPYVKGSFAAANLEATVNWTGWEVIPGLFLLGILILFFRQIRLKKESLAFKTLFGGTAVFVFLTLIFFIGRIEGYSQRAAISFFESKANEDCYVATFAYKSYAQLFYTQKQPPKNKKSNSIDWLLNGDIDKDVYIITKVDKLKYLKNKNLTEIGRENGFVFFKREKMAEDNRPK